MKCFKLSYGKWYEQSDKKAPVCLIADKTIKSRIEDEAKHLGLPVWAPNHCPFADNKALVNPCSQCPVNKK